MMIALSGNYIYKVESKVNYVDPPENRAYHPLQDDSVTLQIEGSGWQLLFSRLRLQPTAINVSLKSLNTRSFIVFSNQLGDINRQFASSQKVISVLPDTLFFDFSKRSVKKIPIRLMHNLTFEKNYGISGPIRMTPNHVIVNGATEDLKNIEVWPTTMLTRNDVDAPVTAKIGFMESKANNIDVFPLSVKVEIPVEMFTEKIIEVPVKVLNAGGREVQVLPERVAITVLTPLSRYPAMKVDSFSVAIDLKDRSANSYSQLPVMIRRRPQFVKMVKVDPQVVDFFIK
ncbi:hypothetical protein [Arcticibacter sp.]|uniref:hypothetical protein n=1 Tax=Arcticibacter sp. TaxID=1872630 RepID=UPI00388CFC28